MNQSTFVELGESRGDTDRDAQKASECHRLSWHPGERLAAGLSSRS